MGNGGFHTSDQDEGFDVEAQPDDSVRDGHPSIEEDDDEDDEGDEGDLDWDMHWGMPKYGEAPGDGAAPWEPAGADVIAGGADYFYDGGGGFEEADCSAADVGAVYGLLRCDSVVVVGQTFPLEVGLSPEPVPDVYGEPMFPPARYRLTIDLVAEGFAFEAGQDHVLAFDVTPEEPYPDAVVNLTPSPEVTGRQADIRAIYSADGQPMGVAFRPVRVVTTLEEAVTEPEPVPAPGISVNQQQADRSVDLTMIVFRSNVGGEGEVVIHFGTHHVGVVLPQLNVNLGSDLEAYARSIVTKMGLAETSPAAVRKARGIGRRIADKLTRAFPMLLRDIAARVEGGPIRMLLLTDEPYVPWELAVVDRLDGSPGQAFLGAQAVVGRWVIPNSLPEAHDVEIKHLLVITGHYPDGTLAAAEEEGVALGETYDAVAVDAKLTAVLECLEGQPPGEVLHFAVHGRHDPGGAVNGLRLVDGEYVDPEIIQGSDLDGHPFVFLNACQVGVGQAQLGVYGGLAAAFLSRGAVGVVAPLWSVKDTVAKEVALDFYAKVFAGEAIGDVVRRKRASFGSEGVSPTVLAYQYFGHPALHLHRAAPGGEG